VFGAGGGTSSYREVEETEVIFLWGSNARETHPIFFHHVLKGVNAGARLFRHRSSADRIGALGGSLAGLEVRQRHRAGQRDGARDHHAGLANQTFIERATTGYATYRDCVEPYSLEYAERVTGIPAEANPGGGSRLCPGPTGR